MPRVRHALHGWIREARGGVVVGAAACVLALVLGVLALALANSQADTERQVKSRLRDRLEVTGAVTTALFQSANKQASADATTRLGAAPRSRALDALVRQGHLAYMKILDARGRVVAASSGWHAQSARATDLPQPSRRGEIGSRVSDVSGAGKSTVIEWAIAYRTPQGLRYQVAGLPGKAIAQFLTRSLVKTPRLKGIQTQVIDARGRVVGTADGAPVGSRVKDAALLSASPGDDEGNYGSDRYFMSSPVGGTTWRMVFSGPKSVMLSPLSGIRSWLPWAVFAALVLTSLAILGLVRRLTRHAERLGEANLELTHTNDALREAQAIGHIGSWHWDPASDGVAWSDELYRIHGLEPGEGEIRLEDYLESVRPKDRQRIQDRMATLLREPGEFSFETRIKRADGEERNLLVRGEVVTDAEGRPVRVTGVSQDVTDRKRFEGQLQHLADHDALTGLYNRRRFSVEVERQLAYSERYGGTAAVLVVDLDHFKYVNDTLGHFAGDDLLVRVGAALRERLRATDVVARLGGDEFAVLLPKAEEREAIDVAESLLEALRESAVALTADGPVRQTASIGISLLGTKGVGDADGALVNADIAMYEAKQSGRDRAEFLATAEIEQRRMKTHLAVSQAVRDALEDDGLMVEAQPILNLRSGVIERHELLLRMVGPEGELIPPAAFLQVAEEAGLIQAVDCWVIRRAIKLLEHASRDGQSLRLTVNLSGSSVTNPETLRVVEEQLADADIEPGSLTFEITETSAIVNIERARHFAERVAALGCATALDDFGAGFGSFYYLKHLPFDVLKIDGEFIQHLPSSRSDQLTVKAIVEMAHGMDKQVIAEFVEDSSTLELLRELGADGAQGYYVGKPARFADAASLAA